MIFELVGSRVLGPYFGTSTIVWASLIGVIMGSLSLGYYIGGKLADKDSSFKNLSLIILFSAISISLTIFIKDSLLLVLQINTIIGSILASLFLFFPASFFLGMVSPYAAKLKIENLNTSGTTIGNLYAISTAGSIVGTFLSGFYLIPNFGTNKLLIILSLSLVMVSLLISTTNHIKIKLSLLFFVFITLLVSYGIDSIGAKNGFIDIDTAYNRIWIYDRIDTNTNKPVKIMGINNENHSSMFLDSDDLVSKYAKYYNLASHFNPDFKKTLILGGAGYSYPKYFLLKYPEATIDVVEIDPKVTELARKYFRLTENERLNIYHEDGRIFLNKTKNKYDIIFGDAFSSRNSLPYQLTTKEAVQRKYDILNDNGIVVLNIISAIDGKRGEFLRAEYATYKSIFPQVFIFPVTFLDNGEKPQNIILIALKSEKEQAFTNIDPEINEYLQRLWKKEISLDIPVLTDDFAPVDHYISRCFN